jgi:hypothetical protein
LKQGEFIDAGDVSHNLLFNTLLNAVGARNPDGSLIDDFGDPTLPHGQIDAMLV